MGTWGAGLYANDLAADIRPAVAMLAKLPLSPDQIVDELCDLYPEAAMEQSDEDHTGFWLVVADQLNKKGVYSTRAQDAALDIIKSGRDIASLAACGMDEKLLNKRKSTLEKLAVELKQQARTAPRVSKIVKPLPAVLFVGEVYAYPANDGQSVNPYFSAKHLEKRPFRQNGYGLFAVVRTGRAFGFLPWYQLALPNEAFGSIPDQRTLTRIVRWSSYGVGTLSPVHKERLMLANLGSFQLAEGQLNKNFPISETRAKQAAISDISIANLLQTTKTPTPLGFIGWLRRKSDAPTLHQLMR